ncbi:MAG: hypothetical protein L7F78_27805 [Syntrophales bacterium LBB04]|nr:hypothetical protein [Syntrophales bacterium LBB04]
MTSQSTDDSSGGPERSHPDREREAGSPPGQPAEAGSDRREDTIGADRIAPSDEKPLGTLIVSLGLALFGIFWMVSSKSTPMGIRAMMILLKLPLLVPSSRGLCSITLSFNETFL